MRPSDHGRLSKRRGGSYDVTSLADATHDTLCVIPFTCPLADVTSCYINRYEEDLSASLESTARPRESLCPDTKIVFDRGSNSRPLELQPVSKPVILAYGEGTEAQDAGKVQAWLHDRDAGSGSVVGLVWTPAGLGQRHGQRHRVERTGLKSRFQALLPS
jgi:hypothetical protein